MKMSSLGKYVYVAFNRGTPGQWPASFGFKYSKGSGQADGAQEQEFGSQAEAKQFINDLLQKYAVYFSLATLEALGLPSLWSDKNWADLGSQI